MYLFPFKSKRISGLIFYLSVVLGVTYLFFYDFLDGLNLKVPMFLSQGLIDGNEFWSNNNLLDEILTIIIISSGIIHGFSKEKVEDELIKKIRLESLAWSVQVNFILVMVETILIFGIHFYEVMVIQLFSILLIFNLKKQHSLNRFYNQKDEK
jgi:hypothetical protein